MRKLLISLVAVFAVTGVSFAQDAGAPNRSLGFYLDSFSGDLTKDPDGNTRTFSGNEFEFGMVYSQNFATVPWLSMYVKALFIVGQRTAYENGDYAGQQPHYSAGQSLLADPRVAVGINYKYGVLAFDTRGLMANENFYTLDFGNAGSLTFNTILEFWAVPVARLGTDIVGSPNYGMYKHSVVDLFALRVDYGISFAKIWRFTTKLAFRFNGDESAKAFKESFSIRWENQIAVAVTDKLGMWVQLRYHIDGLAKPKVTGMKLVDNHLYLQAGLSYSLNLSGL